jgi:NADH:ubiquinone oxidoreductase subunit F (NADH-binding)
MTGGLTQPRLLLHARGLAPMSLADHLDVHGPLPPPGRGADAALLDTIEASGLRGRGGAHVSTALKLRAVAGRRAPVIVANGSESEPASRKDGVLLGSVPHLVLDGLVCAARATGARDAIVYVKHSDTRAARCLTTAIREHTAADDVTITLAEGPATYVAGQETAVIASLNGKPALPSTVPPRPFERGVGRRPTVVCNVETLAHVALIARHGADWFRSVGSPAQPGTALVTVSGAVAAPGVYEPAFGARFLDVVAAAGGLTEPAQALLVGGYGGAWLKREELDVLTLHEGDPLLEAGSVGAGVLAVLGESACGLRESAHVLRYLADQSAGQCGPCLFGLRSISDAFDLLVAGRGGTGVVRRLERWAGDVTGRGACRHPDGAARFLRSALRVFADELREHEAGRCNATTEHWLSVPAREHVRAA